jgi:hypothetical protein
MVQQAHWLLCPAMGIRPGDSFADVFGYSWSLILRLSASCLSSSWLIQCHCHQALGPNMGQTTAYLLELSTTWCRQI